MDHHSNSVPDPQAVGNPARSRFVQLVGLEIHRGEASGDARVTLRMTDDHRNGNGVLHGSMFHALLDCAMGIEAARAAGGKVATAEMSIRFLEAVPGGTLVARARVLKSGTRFVAAEASIELDGRVVAVAQGTFARIRDALAPLTPAETA